MKLSERLYNINARISLRCVAMKKQLTLKELEELNMELGRIISSVRELEEKVE